MARRYVPDRGDLVWLQFNPQAGHEQAGRRPAVTLSPRAYNLDREMTSSLSWRYCLCPASSTKEAERTFGHCSDLAYLHL